MNPLLKAALEYAKRGWRVFPVLALTQVGGCECGHADCDRPGKHPSVSGWNKVATTDPKQILAWWSEHPQRGIGIATGKDSGITVLDADGIEGVAELGAMANPNHGVPPTPTAQSRVGHLHYYFAYNPAIKSQAKKLGAHLDTRGDGGYVVAAPSPHASGSVYVWLIEPGKAELAPWPEWLVEGGGATKAGEKKKRGRPAKETFTPANPQDVARLTAALEFVDPDDEERWGQVGWIMGRAYGQNDTGFALYSAWASRSRKYHKNKTKGHYYERSKEVRGGDLKTVASIYAWAREAGWAWDGDMELRAGELPTIMDQCAQLLGAAEVYSRSGKLVEIRRVKEAALADDIRRNEAQLVIVPISAESVRVRLGRLKTFVRNDRPVDFPADYARTLVAMGEWHGIAELRGIADAPTMRRDGSVVQKAGYDAASGLFVHLDGDWPAVPDRPTRAQAVKALEALLAPFDEVMFDDEDGAAKAAFVATILGAAVRPTLATAPATYFIAPTSGAGKGLLVDAVAVIVGGREAPKKMLPTNDDSEVRKVITSSVLAGDRTIVFDNIPRSHVVRSPALDAALTSTTWSDRRLGSNDQVTLPFMLNVFLTGNNYACHTDAVRRGLYVHIDPKCESPEERVFKIPELIEYLRAHRRSLLVAALTVLRGYAIAERRLLTPFGSFEEWSRRVREAVVWAGMKDPVATQKRMRVLDEDRDELNELLGRLLALKPDGTWFRSSHVKAGLIGDDALRHVVEEWGASSTKAIGRGLRSYVNQVSNGRCLRSRLDAHDKVMEFRVEELAK